MVKISVTWVFGQKYMAKNMDELIHVYNITIIFDRLYQCYDYLE